MRGKERRGDYKYTSTNVCLPSLNRGSIGTIISERDIVVSIFKVRMSETHTHTYGKTQGDSRKMAKKKHPNSDFVIGGDLGPML